MSRETSAGERPILLQKEAVQKAVFDNCFLATTPVVAGVENASGNIQRVVKPIEDVQEDEWVQAKDPRTGEVGWKRVKELHRNWTDEVWYVRVGSAECLPPAQKTGRTERHDVGQAGAGGEDGGEDGEPPPGSHVVRCTAGHPWGVRDADGVLRFRYTAALRVGDRLDPEPGAPAQVVLGIEVRQEVARTYNFEVEGWHTYYVAGSHGQPGVLVHNTSLRRLAGHYSAYARATRRAGQTPMGWARFRGLADDLKKPWEARAGANLAHSGRVGRLARDPSKAADFIEQTGPNAGRTLDLVLGMPIPSRALRQQLSSGGLRDQIIRHMRFKADVTVVSTRHLRGKNLRDVLALVQSLQGAVPGKQLWTGMY